MRNPRRFLLAVFIIAAVGVFFQYSAASSSDDGETIPVAVEYRLMRGKQRDLSDLRLWILVTDKGLAVPKVLDDNPEERQRLVNSLLAYIVVYEHGCDRYNTDLESFRKRFFPLVRSLRAIGLDPCPYLPISGGR